MFTTNAPFYEKGNFRRISEFDHVRLSECGPSNAFGSSLFSADSDCLEQTAGKHKLMYALNVHVTYFL